MRNERQPEANVECCSRENQLNIYIVTTNSNKRLLSDISLSLSPLNFSRSSRYLTYRNKHSSRPT